MAILVQSNKKPSVSFPEQTGSIVTFNSQYALPLYSHKIALTATQSGSGTPSPDNVRTINGYSNIGISATGKNLWGGKALLYSFIRANIRSATVDEVNNTIEFPANTMDNVQIVGVGQFKQNTRYTLLFTIKKSNITASTNLMILYSDGTTEYLLLPTPSAGVKQFFAVKTNPNKTFVGFIGKYQSGRTQIYCDECCVIEGDRTTDDFVPYGTYTTIQIGSTVYGGEYDARTGVLTATYKYFSFDYTTPWAHEISADGYNNFYCICPSDIKAGQNAENSSMMCSASPISAYSGAQQDRCFISYDRNFNFTWGDTLGITTAQGFKDYLQANNLIIEVVAELATPQTIQLPPCPIDTLEGVNNIWADTGETTVEYIKIGG